MTEVDIWIKVFDKLGFYLQDEVCQPGDTNFLVYIWIPTNHTYRVYFNRKTEQVNSVFCVIGGVTKQSFYNQYASTFREIKLQQLV